MKTTPIIRIAIADDNKLLRNCLVRLINAEKNYEVLIEAENGKDLLQKIQSGTILPDVCLLDINMPVMNGYDTMKEISILYPTIKVLAISISCHEYSILQMLKNGAAGYALKNTSFDEIKDAIHSVYINGQYYSNSISTKVISLLRHLNTKNLNLTEREIHFLKLCCYDTHYNNIAAEMNISPKTAETYRNGLFQKLNVKSRTGLVIFTLENGLLNLEQQKKLAVASTAE